MILVDLAIPAWADRSGLTTMVRDRDQQGQDQA